MTETHQLATEIARLNAVERTIVDRFIHRQRRPPEPAEASLSFGDRVADRVTAFGGSWTFISFTVVAITVWMLINAAIAKPFDAYPYILLNLVLACLTVLQAPLIMMSQSSRSAGRPARLRSKHEGGNGSRRDPDQARPDPGCPVG